MVLADFSQKTFSMTDSNLEHNDS